jgi:hypothetical protein
MQELPNSQTTPDLVQTYPNIVEVIIPLREYFFILHPSNITQVLLGSIMSLFYWK